MMIMMMVITNANFWQAITTKPSPSANRKKQMVRQDLNVDGDSEQV